MNLPQNFVPVTLGLAQRYQSYFDQSPRKSADYTFTNLWGWANHYGLGLSFRDNGLCWIYQNRPEPRLWAPVGNWYEANWANESEIIQGTTLFRVPEELAQHLEKDLPGRVRSEESREQWEYLYNRQDLVELKGNRFHKKKNHVNGFIKAYGEDYRPISAENTSVVLDLQEEWCRWRDCDASPSLQAENDVIFRVVGNWRHMPALQGGALYVDDAMVAFAIGEKLDEDTFVVHFEKIQPEFRGVYQAINNAFARHVDVAHSVINREQDMGEEGLRQAKETYNPIGFLQKYRVEIAAKQ